MVEAFQFFYDDPRMPEWAEEAFEQRIIDFDYNGDWYIQTLEGDHYISDGDYIIRGVKGELYPCKPDIFEQTYEAATINAQQERNAPLTLDEMKSHLSAKHPHEIEPLYVVFNPPIPIDYAPRWRDAYNLSQLVATNADTYGRNWLAYRHKPKEDTK